MKRYKLVSKKPKTAVKTIMRTDLYKGDKVIKNKEVWYYANKDFSKGWRIIKSKKRK